MSLLIFTLKTIISMYLSFGCYITIGNVAIENITALEIRENVRIMTSTAKLTMPRSLQYQGQRLDQVVKKGNDVVIKLGYNGQLETEFEGYVREVSPGEPVVIRFEDEMMKLKETSFTRSWSSATLKDVVKYIAPDYESVVSDINLGKFQIKEASATLVFDKLRSIYGIHTRFKGKTLYSGFTYDADFNRHKYHYQKNVKNGNSLNFKLADDTKLRIKAIANLGTGKKLVAYAGDESGALRTRNYGPKTTQADLQKFADAALAEVKFDGYRGTIKGFGYPVVRAGDSLEIIDNRYPERESTNLVDEVTVRVGQWFFERTCKLGKVV